MGWGGRDFLTSKLVELSIVGKQRGLPRSIEHGSNFRASGGAGLSSDLLARDAIRLPQWTLHACDGFSVQWSHGLGARWRYAAYGLCAGGGWWGEVMGELLVLRLQRFLTGMEDIEDIDSLFIDFINNTITPSEKSSNITWVARVQLVHLKLFRHLIEALCGAKNLLPDANSGSG